MADLVERALGVLRDVTPDGYLVGGCVRDWLLGRPLKDLDVAVPVADIPTCGDIDGGTVSPDAPEDESAPTSARVRQVGQAVASALGGAFFWLREGMGVGRVIVREEVPLQIDVVPLAGSLEADLRRRDFTINAMAIPLTGSLGPGVTILDPTGGRADLLQHRLRLASPDALVQDPLRALRAYRFRAALGLSFDPEIERALRTAAPGLERISGERIRDELFTLLESSEATAVIADLLECGLVSPWSAALAASASGDIKTDDGTPIGLSGLKAAESLESWLRRRASQLPYSHDLSATLAENVTAPRSRRALAKLAALAVCTGPGASTVPRSLALSSDEARIVTRAVSGARFLMQAWPLLGRGRFRFWQRWEPGAVEAVLLAIAIGSCHDQSAEIGVNVSGNTVEPLEALLTEMIERRTRQQPPLLTGIEVMTILQLSEGPEIGRYLQQLEEHRADGLIRTAEEARAWLEAERRV